MVNYSDISTEDRLREVEREITQRHRVYPRLIAQGKMTQETAQRQIKIMNAIADDLRDKVNHQLFARKWD